MHWVLLPRAVRCMAARGVLQNMGVVAVALAVASVPLVMAAQSASSSPHTHRASPPHAAYHRQDSALVAQILLAEEARDAGSAALRQGAEHPDARIRGLALRAMARIADPVFAARDSMQRAGSWAQPATPPVYAEPAWRIRYRALSAPDVTCAVITAALADSAWPVRLRALDVLRPACVNRAVVDTLTAWVNRLPTDASARMAGGVSWHAAAHAVVALQRVGAPNAATVGTALVRHAQPEVRQYAVRAAALRQDTMTLSNALGDDDANVRALAIEQLSELLAPSPAMSRASDSAAGGEAWDQFTTAIIPLLDDASAPQVVLAAAQALVAHGRVPSPEARAIARELVPRWVRRENASERDVRVALLALAGGTAADDTPPPRPVTIPSGAIALALGEQVMLRVTIDPRSGGGHFDVRLRGDIAPVMAAQIAELASAGFYDGLLWHRVEHDFVIQGGSPGANEYVGYARYLRDALFTVPHVRGTVGMSTRGHDTGDAQWFVNLKDNARLTRDYTIFGEVIAGMDIVDGILEGDRIATIRALTSVAPREAAHSALSADSSDVAFMQGMIGHHAQALVMSAMVPERTANTALQMLARRIAVSQHDEIEQMQRWLREHGLPPVPVDSVWPATGAEHGAHGAGHAMHGGHAGHAQIPGMLTPAQLDTLQAARGRAF
jgi:cyclophilin family peptidyl-prolyl cis-trans isomerase